MLNNMAYVWLGTMALFIVIEAAVPGLVSIWFALGALAAMVSALLNAPVWLQVLWFVIVSTAALILTRPLAKKYVNSKVQPTNADRVIGKSCIVREAVDNVLGTGSVVVDGKEWTARCADDACKAEPGEVLKVLRIEGVKLIVGQKE